MDIVVLTECWLHGSTVPLLSGYNFYKTSNHRNQNSGVVVYVKNTWNASVSELTLENADCLAIHIPKLISILCVYRSRVPSPLEGFLGSLESAIANHISDKIPLIIAGDLNVNIMNSTDNTQSLQYQCFMAEYGLRAAINQPTRGLACLDHIYLNSQYSQSAIGIICKTDITDHHMIMLGMNIKKTKFERLSRILS